MVEDRDIDPNVPSGLHKRPPVAIWFFIGVLLLIYGIIILIAGIRQLAHPPATVLANLHATFWGGFILTVIGAGYTVKFWPHKRP
jgi:hypothetical protein